MLALPTIWLLLRVSDAEKTPEPADQVQEHHSEAFRVKQRCSTRCDTLAVISTVTDVTITEHLLDDIDVEVLQRTVKRRQTRARNGYVVVTPPSTDARTSSSEPYIQVENNVGSNMPLLPADQWVEDAVHQEGNAFDEIVWQDGPDLWSFPQDWTAISSVSPATFGKQFPIFPQILFSLRL
jgi:hypothetical protein